MFLIDLFSDREPEVLILYYVLILKIHSKNKKLFLILPVAKRTLSNHYAPSLGQNGTKAKYKYFQKKIYAVAMGFKLYLCQRNYIIFFVNLSPVTKLCQFEITMTVLSRLHLPLDQRRF